MSLALSTKLRNDLLGGKNLRQVFEDAVIKIYSGSAPASADSAATGTLLVTISKSSGTVSSGEVSTAQEAKVAINDHGSGSTYKVLINSTTAVTYTNTPDLDAIPVAAALTELINNCGEPVWAAAAGTVNIYVRSKVRGLAFTIADNSSTGSITVTESAVANSASDAVKLGAPSAGAITKDANTWSGVAVATNTAGYFRMVNSADDEGATGSTYPRIQGSVATSGAEMTLSNTTITSGATQTIDSATITMPED